MKRLAVLLCALCLSPAAAGTGAAQVQGVHPGEAKVAAGRPVSFKLKGLDGKVYDAERMRGEVLLVSFGATWCAPCVSELAALAELQEEYRAKPVRFLWVSVEDERRTPNALLRHFAKTYNVALPVLRDPAQQTFAQFSDSVRLPTVVFIDREGRFSAPVHRGMSQEPIEYKQLMRARLNALLQRE